MDIEQNGTIEHMRIIHHEMGRAIVAHDFVMLLECTGDMELLAGKAAHTARVTEELLQSDSVVTEQLATVIP